MMPACHHLEARPNPYPIAPQVRPVGTEVAGTSPQWARCADAGRSFADRQMVELCIEAAFISGKLHRGQAMNPSQIIGVPDR